MSDISRASDENPYKHIRQKSNDDWFMYWLCEDKEFRKDVSLLNTPGVTGKEYKSKLHALRSKYGITEGEFVAVAVGLHAQGTFDFPFTYIDGDEDSVTVKISKEVKRNEYISAWPEIKEMLTSYVGYGDGTSINIKQSKTRVRAADDTQLIYAVFKARKSGLTFRQIYRLYQDGKLPCYVEKPTNQFSSEDSLERYFNKYKPAR